MGSCAYIRVAWQRWQMRQRRRRGRGLRFGVWRNDDPLAGEDRQGRPMHGTIGPAKRAIPCEGRCWTPNRYGVCKVCGGYDPQREGSVRQ